MDKKKYLFMNEEELHEHLISDILSSPNEALALIEALEAEERYFEDYVFRTFVDTGKILFYSIKGDLERVISDARYVIERARALKVWRLVALNQNLLGVSYHMMSMLERALEYYRQAIRTEEIHGLNSITITACNNIALLYLTLDGEEPFAESYKYLNLSLKALERGGSGQPRYHSKLVYTLSSLIPPLCMTRRLDEVPPIFRRIRTSLKYDISPDSKCAYHRAGMFYALYNGEYEKGKREYLRAVDMYLEDNHIGKMALLENFIIICEELGLGYDFYIDELLKAESMEKSVMTISNINVYSSLRKYYKTIGNKEKYDEISEKYITLLLEDADTLRGRQFSSLKMVESIIENSEGVEDIESKNIELRLVAEEATRHKNALTEAYQRIELINELGKRLTSSLNLETIVDYIYHSLSLHLPIKNFCLALVDSKNSVLRSLAYYHNGIIEEGFTIPLSDKQSIFIACYNSGEMIISQNLSEDERFENAFSGLKEPVIQSVIFMPLRVEGRIVGVCTVQDVKADAYNAKHIAFLREVIPYLSIALNNAQYSLALKQEIRTRQAAEAKLEVLNKKLSLLSSLDSLTQISNRRDFEDKVLDLLNASKLKKKEASLFMVDVDYFKLYNDTYGHLGGDNALKQVALIVQSNLNSFGGLAARFGGEEFIGATVGLSADASRRLADKICADVFNLGIINEKAPLGRLSVSVGLSTIRCADPSQKSLLMKEADDALYEAKTGGKNRVVMRELH